MKWLQYEEVRKSAVSIFLFFFALELLATRKDPPPVSAGGSGRRSGRLGSEVR